LDVAGPGGRAGTIRLLLGATVATIAAALLVSTLIVAPTSVANLGGTSAKAGGCRWANSGPRQVSARHARHAVVCQINRKRHRHGMRGVKPRYALRKAGKRHSRYMQRRNCFAHQCPGEKDLVRRIHATSYLPCKCNWRVGETLAWGKRRRGTPRAIVRAWMHSPRHRRVMLDRRLRNVGIGLVWGSPSKRGAKAATYTADFGFKSR
jgi:uncharacterized protein YkwD